ncbi:oxygenase MpaB family protein [Pseudarthrobacter albicanus]|uniref:oxygenase MpaB family protein n=1 Tax=Pseudarthrobacter albicanus TaxID=2823873 RepID=UPI0027DD46D5|nr:oxygenase MpaB family protein [Pseudarthrobacter albicanus]
MTPGLGGRILSGLAHPTRKSLPEGADPYAIYRTMVLYDFQKEIHAGFFVSYYRNFAIPSIARTLADRGEMRERPMKRSYDTGIVIHEIIANGFDSDRGQAMTALLRRVHQGVPGSSEDFLYVLMTLLVLPLRWVDQHGWRKLTALEEEAAVAFYAELGRRMGLDPAPATLEAAGRFLDDYEERRLGPSPEGSSLLGATVEALKVRLHRFLRPLTPVVLALMMDKPRVAVALGLKPSPAWLRLVFNAVLRFRAVRASMRPLPAQPSFVPGKTGTSVYPDGYTLGQIGPC